jgi:hypothetical protein
MKKFLFIIIFFILGCGYQSIYSTNNVQNFEFYKITTEGEQDINRKITNSISLEEDQTNKLLNEFLLITTFNVEETSKNTKGQIQSYRSSILVNLTISRDKKIIRNKVFSEEFTYNTKDNKFELVEYQSSVKDDLINRVLDDIVLFLNM